MKKLNLMIFAVIIFIFMANNAVASIRTEYLGNTTNFYQGVKLIQSVTEFAYDVLKTDTLRSISVRYKINLNDLFQQNDLDKTINPDRNLLKQQPGIKRLKIFIVNIFGLWKSDIEDKRTGPEKQKTIFTFPIKKRISKKKLSPAKTVLASNSDKKSVIKRKEWIVKKGDTIWGIAHKNKLKVSDVVKWNNLSNTRIIKIKPGQSILLEAPHNDFVVAKALRLLPSKIKKDVKKKIIVELVSSSIPVLRSRSTKSKYKIPSPLYGIHRIIIKKYGEDYLWQVVKAIDEASLKYGVSREMIASVIYAESFFNSREVSKANCKGLMQLLPNTFAGMGGTGDIFDVHTNIDYGTKYLMQMYKRFNHNFELTLAGYNAGPTRVERLGRVPRIKETKKYIEKIKKLHPSQQFLNIKV